MILIVGGAGFIGSHMIAALMESGIEACVFDNLSTGHRSYLPDIPFVQGDILNRETLDALFKAHPAIEGVMHFASLIQVGESVRKPMKYYRNNLAGTLNLLDAMLENNVRNLVFSSSAAVYGEPHTIPISEDHPLSPVNPYGRTKKMIEDILRDYNRAYGLRFVALRYFNAAGAHPSGTLPEHHIPETHLIPLALQAAMRKSPSLNIFGNDFDTHDGTCIRDYVHVNDLCDAHMLAWKALQDTDAKSYNLGNGNGYSVLEVIRCIEKMTGMRVPYTFVSRREGDPPVLVADSTLARKELNWSPRKEQLGIIIEDAWRAFRTLDKIN